MTRRLLGLVAAFGPVLGAQGQVFTYVFGGGDIPDASPTGGLLLAGTVAPGGAASIAGIRVTLSISGTGSSGAYNGDFFAYLAHDPGTGDAGFAVLLNRVGARDGDAFGYGDNGFSVTFDDASPAAADIHTYRQTLFGSHDVAIPDPGVLSGTWQTDGRETDPGMVLDTDPRTATLGSFIGLDPVGIWQLYVQDLSAGGTAQVDHWDLEISGAVVPEPAGMAVLIGGVLGGFALVRRRRAAARRSVSG